MRPLTTVGAARKTVRHISRRISRRILNDVQGLPTEKNPGE